MLDGHLYGRKCTHPSRGRKYDQSVFQGEFDPRACLKSNSCEEVAGVK